MMGPEMNFTFLIVLKLLRNIAGVGFGGETQDHLLKRVGSRFRHEDVLLFTGPTVA